MSTGQYLNIDPMKAMFNAAWFEQALHMSIAAFAATGFAVAGVHALMIITEEKMLNFIIWLSALRLCLAAVAAIFSL